MTGLVERLLGFVMVVVLLGATSGEAIGYRRACAHHEAAQAGVDAAAETSSHHGSHGAQDAGDDGHGGPCTCLGNCTVSTPEVSVPFIGVDGILPAPAGSIVVRPAPVRPVVQIRIAYLIPFSNAPPHV